jgi:hypothetical protein
LKNNGNRRAVNGSPQMSSVPGRFLLIKHELPTVVAYRDEPTVVIKVNECASRRLVLLAGEKGELVIAVKMDPISAVANFPTSQQPVSHLGIAGGGKESRKPVVTAENVVRHAFRFDAPGQRTMHGTRKAPSQLVSFSLRNGVMAASGQEFMCGPLSVV